MGFFWLWGLNFNTRARFHEAQSCKGGLNYVQPSRDQLFERGKTNTPVYARVLKHLVDLKLKDFEKILPLLVESPITKDWFRSVTGFINSVTEFRNAFLDLAKESQKQDKPDLSPVFSVNAFSKRVGWCGGRDSNPCSPKARDLESCASSPK